LWVDKGKVTRAKERRRIIMAAEQEIRATHEEVEAFVRKLRDFHGSLGDSEQAMLESVLDTTRGEVGGYGMYKRSGVSEESWDDLVGWLEDQGGEYTEGFRWTR
jgi:Rad3-related DNA helicase